MGLQALLAEVDPSWYGTLDQGELDQAELDRGALDPELVARARDSRLGRRMLARWLAAGAASALLAPAPGAGPGDEVVARWPRASLTALTRDLGALAYAPAIRAEVRREPVRRLKQALGNSYLLALDNTVWNGRVDPLVGKRLAAGLSQALAADAQGEHDAALHALLDRQGRAELNEWASANEPALAEWARLLQPSDTVFEPAHLPEKPLLRVYSHHQSRQTAH